MAAAGKLLGYELPIPSHYDAKRVGVGGWYVQYEALEEAALAWRKKHDVALAATDRFKLAVLPIDLQETFCIKGAQLFVGGRSGEGAIEDNRRICEWIYRNSRLITRIFPTLDTHKRAQVFHRAFWVDKDGNHPAPATLISLREVESGKWQVNGKVAYSVLGNANAQSYLQAYGLHYVKQLTQDGKYDLMVWPYHGMLGGVEHALVPAVHEAFFFHNALREAETVHQIKGGNPLAENYAITHPEVTSDHRGKSNKAYKNQALIDLLMTYDMIVIFGQAKSHCVAWSIQGLLDDILVKDPSLAQKIYLAEDGCSPVVIPGVVDFSDMADAAFEKFAKAGMHRVRLADPIKDWGGVAAQAAV